MVVVHMRRGLCVLAMCRCLYDTSDLDDVVAFIWPRVAVGAPYLDKTQKYWVRADALSQLGIEHTILDALC